MTEKKLKKKGKRGGKLVMKSLKLGDPLPMVCYSAPTSSITKDIDM